MSRGNREQYERRYHVTDTRTHPKGYTEYKVTAQFICKKNPQDVKEVAVWKRYSDFKKLHAELSYTHRNLFQRNQEFPTFPRAQVFGRFEPPVIEERRQAAEDLLKFTVKIPALYNSPQLKEFFREGEVVIRTDGPDSADVLVLPPPLSPEPLRCCSPEFEGNDTHESRITNVVPAEDTEHVVEPVVHEPSQFDLLFELSDNLDTDDGAQTQAPIGRQHSLTHNDLALFDPCFNEDGASLDVEADLNLLSLGETSALPTNAEEEGVYLSQATKEVQKAMEKESAGDYLEAFRLYRSAVDILLQGVKDEPCSERRNAVTRRTAEYLCHAENILKQHMSVE
ncbi:hypothetical protein GDO86_008677 [Hymenochirus boettgeri]|uniref:PX domain-containing protein n=1 Tax=Hymenochirus boettgeri TaxID=247094 RepID=A0A8T2J3X9_9PIPI|nr:hypothetical protein GDO86_008677 [Hymenochirus boettgeri]